MPEVFLIDVPMPAMGATVNELTVIGLKIQVGAQVVKGQKIAELESDKSVFEFESPADGTVRAIFGNPGDVKPSGAPFVRLETGDASLKHLQVQAGTDPAGTPRHAPAAARATWTPRAVKLAQEAGLDPAAIHDIEATGPGGRVSGDDFSRYLTKLKSR